MWKSPITSTSCVRGREVVTLPLGAATTAKNSPPSLLRRFSSVLDHVVFRGVAMTSLTFAHAEKFLVPMGEGKDGYSKVCVAEIAERNRLQ